MNAPDMIHIVDTETNSGVSLCNKEVCRVCPKGSLRLDEFVGENEHNFDICTVCTEVARDGIWFSHVDKWCADEIMYWSFDEGKWRDRENQVVESWQPTRSIEDAFKVVDRLVAWRIGCTITRPDHPALWPSVTAFRSPNKITNTGEGEWEVSEETLPLTISLAALKAVRDLRGEVWGSERD